MFHSDRYELQIEVNALFQIYNIEKKGGIFLTKHHKSAILWQKKDKEAQI